MSSNPSGVFTFFNLSKNFQNIFFGQILTNLTKPVKVFLILKCTFIQMVLFRNWSNVFRKAGANYNIIYIQMIFYWNENILIKNDQMQWGIMILVIQTFNICFVLDDITVTADGTDTYHLVKAAGKYKYVIIYLS